MWGSWAQQVVSPRARFQSELLLIPEPLLFAFHHLVSLRTPLYMQAGNGVATGKIWWSRLREEWVSPSSGMVEKCLSISVVLVQKQISTLHLWAHYLVRMRNTWFFKSFKGRRKSYLSKSVFINTHLATALKPEEEGPVRTASSAAANSCSLWAASPEQQVSEISK